MAMHRIGPLLLSAVALLAGCAPYVTEWSPDDAPKTLQVDVARHTYAVQFAPGAATLGAAEATRLAHFVQAGGILPQDRIAIAAADPATKLAERRRNALLAALHGQGVGASAAAASLPKIGQDRVVLEIEHAVVTPPECPNWSKPPIDYSAQVSSNFGCATATNLAQMIADPADLLHGNPNAPGDPGEAAGAVQAYRSQQGWGAPRSTTPFAGDFTSGASTTSGGQ
jgi:pilus assembly protein CpaD